MEERLARLALDAFEALPPRYRPRDGEWVPMSALILSHKDGLWLASLATGSKCLPATLLPKLAGLVLHDCHSEVLALRGLNRFFLEEALRILTHTEYTSPYLIYNDTPDNKHHFHINPSVSIHLVSTEPPCGDASMEFIISAQPDPTPWSCPPPSEVAGTLPGRSGFSNLAAVRRKPSRPDAPPTLSKSCTDKLTLKQFTSVLSSLSSSVISPENAYISTFTVPFDKFSEEGYTRAFTTRGRLKDINNIDIKDDTGYSFHPLLPTPLPQSFDFKYKYSKPPPGDTITKASNISTLYINHPSGPITEVLISGVKQGNPQLSKEDRKGSLVCRKKMWILLKNIVELLPDQELKERVQTSSYADLKANIDSRARLKDAVVELLGGWERNRGDDAWGLP